MRGGGCNGVDWKWWLKMVERVKKEKEREKNSP